MAAPPPYPGSDKQAGKGPPASPGVWRTTTCSGIPACISTTTNDRRAIQRDCYYTTRNHGLSAVSGSSGPHQMSGVSGRGSDIYQLRNRNFCLGHCPRIVPFWAMARMLPDPVLRGRMQGRGSQLSQLPTHHREVQPNVKQCCFSLHITSRKPISLFRINLFYKYCSNWLRQTNEQFVLWV